MASEEAAATVVNHYTSTTPQLRSQPVYIQYSYHKEIKTDNLSDQAVSIVFPFNRLELHLSCVLIWTRIELIFFMETCDAYVVSRPFLRLTLPCQCECTRSWEGT